MNVAGPVRHVFDIIQQFCGLDIRLFIFITYNGAQ